MNKTQYNQYLVKKAQRGMTRFQKMAAGRGFGPALNHYTPTDTPATTEERHAAIRESTEPFEVTPPPIEEATPAAEDKPTDKSNPYLPYALGSAGAGALIGALINLVRKKSVLSVSRNLRCVSVVSRAAIRCRRLRLLPTRFCVHRWKISTSRFLR